jgi:glycolate oxidase iron-sulfur subunit
MQTNFSIQQLADSDTAVVNDILRSCVHCGFCTATCPTYVLLGDELDSPRGRIYLMKQMFEDEAPATKEVVTHIDRCLSCLSCMTTCPSGVHYQHLVDQGRQHIEETYKRPFSDRIIRWILASTVPYPSRFRFVLLLGIMGRFLKPIMPKHISSMMTLVPYRLAKKSPVDKPQIIETKGKYCKRVALLNGCAQTVLAPQINEATVRLLSRFGVEVVVSDGAGCCGSLAHHLGKTNQSINQAKANIDAWTREIELRDLDALIINTSGCGTQVKDYGFMFRDNIEYAKKADKISEIARDITEFMVELNVEFTSFKDIADQRVTYHSACSMQHGQGIKSQPLQLLSAVGFDVMEPLEAHLCCGSAGTYNILQKEIADQLRDRKVANISLTEPTIVATGNIGCITQLAGEIDAPIVHTVELLDWATGGPKPFGIK